MDYSKKLSIVVFFTLASQVCCMLNIRFLFYQVYQEKHCIPCTKQFLFHFLIEQNTNFSQGVAL